MNLELKSLQHCKNKLDSKARLQEMKVQRNSIQTRKTVKVNRMEAG